MYMVNKIRIDCVFGNSKFLVPSTLAINLGFASVNSQCLRDNKLAIPSYPVNKYILLSKIEGGKINLMYYLMVIWHLSHLAVSTFNVHLSINDSLDYDNLNGCSLHSVYIFMKNIIYSLFFYFWIYEL
jgi:hypothetical protein